MGQTVGKCKPAGSIPVRLRIYLDARHQQEPVISRLISQHGLEINITGACLGDRHDRPGWLDLELRGTSPQLQQGLAYLQALQLHLVGKPNPAGDSWFC